MIGWREDMNRKAIAIITALAAINVISTSVYAVTGGISFEAVERSQHKQVSSSQSGGFSATGKNPWDRLKKNATETSSTEKEEIIDKETIKEIQELLNAKGYQCGTPDGIAGKNTCNAIIQYKKDNNMEETSMIDQELVDSLKGITPTPMPTPLPTPTLTPKFSTSTYKYAPKTTIHTCQATGCSKESTYQLEGITGSIEYYCAEHYLEVLKMYMDLIDRYNK